MAHDWTYRAPERCGYDPEKAKRNTDNAERDYGAFKLHLEFSKEHMEAATQQTAANDLRYRFDDGAIPVTLNVRPGADKPAHVTHQLRKPTLNELIARSESAVFERIAVNKREDEWQSSEEAANVKLWNKIILQVQGYDFGDGQSIDAFRTLTNEQKEQMKASHKVAAVRGLYRSDCSIDYGELEEAPVMFGAQEWRVKQEIGAPGDHHAVIHTLREPTETERLKFDRNALKRLDIRGARKAHSRTWTNITAHIEMYDALIIDVQGATVGSYEMNDSRAVERKRWIEQIDPMFKVQVVQVLMAAIEAELQD